MADDYVPYVPIPYTPLPYVSSREYSNRPYTQSLMELVGRAGQREAEATRRRSELLASRTGALGQIASSTLGSLFAGRDEAAKLAAAREQQRLDNEYRERAYSETVKAREAQQQWQRDQFRESRAASITDDMGVGESFTPDRYEQAIAGTGASNRYQYNPATEATLPARPFMDTYGISGLRPGGLQPNVSEPSEVSVPMAPPAGREAWMPPENESMSRMNDAQPERYTRVPNTSERLAITAAERAAQTARLVELNRLRDDERNRLNDIKNDKYREESANFRAQTLALAAERLRYAQEQARGTGELTNKQLGFMFQLSNGLKSHPAYVDMLDISTGWQGVQAGLNQADGFGDITAINAFQRMVDPGATVREGDVALLQSSSSFLDKLRLDYPIAKLQKGDKFPAPVRERMRKIAAELYAVRAGNFNTTVGAQTKSQAKAAGVPYNLVGTDFPLIDTGNELVIKDGQLVKK